MKARRLIWTAILSHHGEHGLIELDRVVLGAETKVGNTSGTDYGYRLEES